MILHARFTKFLTEDPPREYLGLLDLSGNRLPQAPTYTTLLGLQYSWDVAIGQITFRAEGNWVGRTYFTGYNLPEFAQKPYGRYNLYVSFASADKHWDGSLFMKDVGDGTYLSSANQGSTLNGAAVFGAYSPPRRFGVRASYHLGTHINVSSDEGYGVTRTWRAPLPL